MSRVRKMLKIVEESVEKYGLMLAQASDNFILENAVVFRQLKSLKVRLFACE